MTEQQVWEERQQTNRAQTRVLGVPGIDIAVHTV